MTRRDSPEYEAHRAARQLGTAPDPAVDAAANAVALARHRLRETRRQFIRRQAGSTDVAIAEHDLSLALDQLDRANGNTP